MRPVITLLLLITSIATLMAQTRISAEQILADLDAGKDIVLTDAVITGDLNFIDLKDREAENSGNWGKQERYLAHVRNSISFTNCEFEGKVLGYYSEDKTFGKNLLINVNFHESVLFKNCQFRNDAHFKYSRFYATADFSESRFREDALFKYTEFDENADFTKSTFNEEANFKYTEFDENADYSGATFSGSASFKYTEFDGNLSLANARFMRSADFKYTQFPDNSDMTGVDFGNDADFKYAKLGRKDFRGTK